jgi:hypothetical protein
VALLHFDEIAKAAIWHQFSFISINLLDLNCFDLLSGIDVPGV